MRDARPEAERFWEKVQKGDGCWLWLAQINDAGYGMFRRNGRAAKELAHRTAYRLTTGSDPEKSCVLHECDNPCCVRPSHLFLGTHQDNMADKTIKGRAAKTLTPEDVRLARAMRANGATLDEIKKTIGIASRGYTSALCSGKYWRHVNG